MATKAQIARRLYSCSLSELSAGEKAAVTREFNRGGSATASASSGDVKTVKVGRLGSGQPLKEYALANGTTVKDLLQMAKISLDEDKEAVNAQSTGMPVDIDTKIVSGETYIVTAEIKSA